jgi:hypothetical protein
MHLQPLSKISYGFSSSHRISLANEARGADPAGSNSKAVKEIFHAIQACPRYERFSHSRFIRPRSAEDSAAMAKRQS